MRVNQHAQHAHRFVVFDETHAAHVRGEIVDEIDISDRALAALLVAEIELHVFNFWEHLKPFLEGFHIHGSDFLALTKEISDQMAANKSAAAADYDFLWFHLASAPQTSLALYRERARLQPGANYAPFSSDRSADRPLAEGDKLIHLSDYFCRRSCAAARTTNNGLLIKYRFHKRRGSWRNRYNHS